MPSASSSSSVGSGATANAFAMAQLPSAAARFRVPSVANNNSSSGNGTKPTLVSFEASHLAQTHQELKQLQQRRTVESSNQNGEAQEPEDDDDNNDNQEEDEDDEEDEDEDEANDDDDGMIDNNELDAQVNGNKTRKPVSQGTTNDNQFKFGATVASDASAAISCGVPVIRRRNVGVPKFLRFLYQILEVEACEIIAWSHNGTAFQIRQPDELAELILPKYFKHNKVSSFQRQLNYFGFKKWTKTQTNICTFSHPFFLRGEKDKMKLIKRKERLGPIGAPTSSSGGNIGVGGSATPADGAAAVSTFSSGDANGNSNTSKNATKVPPSAPAKAALNSRRFRANSTVKIKGIEARELAMRRHSTGTLALSAALDHPGVGGLTNRKRAGTIDLELELQAQKGMDMKDLALRQPSRAKRKSLPHVMLPPSLKDRKGNQLFAPDFSALDGKTGHFGSLRMGPSDSLRQDASPVVPVTSEMLMQNAYHHRQQQQHLHHGVGNAGSGLYQFASSSMKSDMNDSSMDMSDLSGPLQSSATWISPSSNNCYQHAPQPQHDSGSGQKDQNLMMMMPYKFAGDGSNAGNGMPPFDGIPIIDYATNSAQLSNHPMKMHSLQQQQQQHPHQQHQQQPNSGFQQHPHHQQPQHGTQQKDYIDVLLESAALDDQLSSQSSSVAEPQGPGLSAVWEHHYMHAPQQPHQSGPAHVSPFGLMQHHHQHPSQQPPSQQHHLHPMHQIQLSAMDAMNSNNHQGQRF
ncbi:Heat shock factor protein 3, partial [Globisporangium splendens]